MKGRFFHANTSDLFEFYGQQKNVRFFFCSVYIIWGYLMGIIGVAPFWVDGCHGSCIQCHLRHLEYSKCFNLKIGMPMYPDHLWNWVDFGLSLLNFLIFVWPFPRLPAYLTGLWRLRGATAIISLDLIAVQVRYLMRGINGEKLGLKCLNVGKILTT